MKVKIEIEPELSEDEVLIRCRELSDAVVELQRKISRQENGRQCISLTRKDTEYFVPVQDIYFFETEGGEIRAHTGNEIFDAGYKLYELEELLPAGFMRISKSTIVNLDYVYSITRNLTASSVVEFVHSSKKALVSRGYYKALIERLSVRRMSRPKQNG